MSLLKRRAALWAIVAALLALATPGLTGVSTAAAAASSNARCGGGYVPAWHASPARLLPVTGYAGQSPLADRTLRLVVHPHTGGDAVRIRLSNRHGETPITLGPVYVGVVEQGARLVSASNRPVTFGGKPTVTLAAGADAVSDQVDHAITAFQDIAISIYVPTATAPITGHGQAMQTSYLSESGDHTATTTESPYRTTITTWPFLSGVDVRTDRRLNTVVTLGDSITDGDGSTPDTNRRWPDFLARRLAAAGGQRYMAVANAGIGANQILRDAVVPPWGGDSALRRFSMDVIAQPGVTDVILHEGTNDIGLSGASAEEVIAGMQQLAAQAHAAGLRIHATTQTPAGGALLPGHSSAAAVATREAVNEWVRAHWRDYFDGVIDFGALLADPSDPTRLASAYDSGDGLHPNDAGYARMASAIDLTTLTGSSCSTRRPAMGQRPDWWLSVTAATSSRRTRRVPTRDRRGRASGHERPN
jgi:lysophospholipase L1-like esterase